MARSQLFAFAKDHEAEQFVGEVLELLTTRYRLSSEEATSRINALWRDTVMGGPNEIAYHEPPEFWAERFYFGVDAFHPMPAQSAAFSVGDLVRVLRVGPTPRHVAIGRPQEGDRAAIRSVLRGPSDTILVLEAVGTDERTLWEADFCSEEIELVTPWQSD
jgi:hypothetical protein